MGPAHFRSGVPTSLVHWIRKTPSRRRVSSGIPLLSPTAWHPFPSKPVACIHKQNVRVSQVPGDPFFDACSGLRLRWIFDHLALAMIAILPLATLTAVASTSVISELNPHSQRPRCLRFRATITRHPAKLATGLLAKLWPGRIYTDWDRVKSFRSFPSFPLPRLRLAR